MPKYKELLHKEQYKHRQTTKKLKKFTRAVINSGCSVEPAYLTKINKDFRKILRKKKIYIQSIKETPCQPYNFFVSLPVANYIRRIYHILVRKQDIKFRSVFFSNCLVKQAAGLCSESWTVIP